MVIRHKFNPLGGITMCTVIGSVLLVRVQLFLTNFF